MFQLLCHQATFSRIEENLKAYEHILKPVVMADDGSFKAAWSEEVVGAPDPQIVYGTTDAWFCPGVANFAGAVLKASDLKWFQSSAAGLEHPMLKAFGEKASIYTSGHAQSEAIAEWVLWAGFDFFGRGNERRAAQARAEWHRTSFREIASTHWVIVGFGEIGKSTARRLRALGASVTGVRRTPGPDKEADEIIHPGKLLEALPEADAVLLCCPITEETHGLAKAEFFAAMKDDALLLNVGRGGLVDEPALLAGLDEGKPAHAALDVVSEEPLPPDNPIWSHPKITLTAHTSAWTKGSSIRTDAVFLKNLDAFVKGDHSGMAHVISREAFDAQHDAVGKMYADIAEGADH